MRIRERHADPQAAEAVGLPPVNIAIRPPVDWEALQQFVTEVMPAFR
ncbi:MAG: hypothetical protein ACE5EF_01125 [Dehalococcoidia bacterium]